MRVRDLAVPGIRAAWGAWAASHAAPHRCRCRACGLVVRSSLTMHQRRAHGVVVRTRAECLARYEEVT